MSGAFGETFERVVVVNLARRPDRMSALAAQLQRLGVAFERFEAVDGRDPAVAAAWERYRAQPLAEPEPGAEVRSYRDFYLGDFSDQARLAFVEQRGRAKAIATPGAWGLLASMTGVLERAVAEGWRSALILEDDVLFHAETATRAPAMLAELPPDWLIVQLGAMQLHWEEDWIRWRSERLYQCEGSSIGAHAVGLRRRVFGPLLEACRRRDLPYDIGALQTLKRRHRARSFTLYPNLAIQDPSDSEIGMSKIFFDAAKSEDNVYRWRWSAYGLARLQPWRAAQRPAPSPRPAADPTFAPPPADTPASTRRADPHALVEDDAAPLQPHGAERPAAKRVAVLLVGLSAAAAQPYLELLARQQASGEAAPVAVVDDDALFAPLRGYELAFEHLPPLGAYARFGDAFDAEVYRLRRLMLIRRKWRPARVLAFGAPAKALLAAWRASPFEPKGPEDDLQDG